MQLRSLLGGWSGAAVVQQASPVGAAGDTCIQTTASKNNISTASASDTHQPSHHTRIRLRLFSGLHAAAAAAAAAADAAAAPGLDPASFAAAVFTCGWWCPFLIIFFLGKLVSWSLHICRYIKIGTACGAGQTGCAATEMRCGSPTRPMMRRQRRTKRQVARTAEETSVARKPRRKEESRRPLLFWKGPARSWARTLGCLTQVESYDEEPGARSGHVVT